MSPHVLEITKKQIKKKDDKHTHAHRYTQIPFERSGICSDENKEGETWKTTSLVYFCGNL